MTFLAGGALGLPIGIWSLLGTDHRTYTHVLGAFLLAYGAYMLVRRPVVLRRQPAALDVAAEVLGGITEDAVGFPGTSVTILCAMTSQPKDRQRAIFQPFILIMQMAALLRAASPVARTRTPASRRETSCACPAPCSGRRWASSYTALCRIATSR